MSLIKRMENREIKLEKKINNKMKKIEELNLKFHNNDISKKKFLSKRKRAEEIIKTMNVRLRMLRGEVAKKKRLSEVKNKGKNRWTTVESKYLMVFKNMNMYEK